MNHIPKQNLQSRYSGSGQAPLVDSRVGGDSQSNYLVSNDGVQTMDLPRNMLGPGPSNRSARKTPVLIPPVKYIVYNNPQVAYDFLINKGYNVDNRIPSVYQFAQIFIKENGDPGILEFVKNCHPDKDTIIKAFGLDKKESNFQETPTASTEPVGTPQTTPLAQKTETSTEKAEGWIKLNQKTIIIVLAVVVFFLLINRAAK
jgi:hypothetical protein